MIIRKRIKAKQLKGLVDLPVGISDDTLLELAITEVKFQEKGESRDNDRVTARDLLDLFHSRLRVVGTGGQPPEEVFSLEDVSWQDISEMKAALEEEGYGVQIDQSGNNVRIKLLLRFV